VHLATLRVGGLKMDEAIMQHLRHAHCLEVGELTAEAVKIAVGCAEPDDDDRTLEVRGRDLRTGLPAMVSITREEVRANLEPVTEEIVRGVQSALEELPAEVSAGLIESGMVLTGGGAQLAGLADRILRETGVQARRADSDVQSVAVVGAGKLFRDGHYTPVRELMVKRKAERRFNNGDANRSGSRAA
jgi:rod shape-determining protein MreB and related proteins